MLKRTVKYTDFNGKTKTKILMFNLNGIEISRMFGADIELGEEEMQKRLIERFTGDKESGVLNGLINGLDSVFEPSYGHIEEFDGEEVFVKNPKASKLFINSECYAQFIADLLQELTKDPTVFEKTILEIANIKPNRASRRTSTAKTAGPKRVK